MASYASMPHASVLYVEDNLVNALLMEALLARRPHITLHLATDARTAMEMVTRVQPTILLIDMNLPDATGVELLQRLRSLPALRHVPAIVVSASAGPEAEHIARLGGFDGYWTKPLDLERTLAELDRLLSLEGSSCV
jgi:CheY-like chemotaxis protein